MINSPLDNPLKPMVSSITGGDNSRFYPRFLFDRDTSGAFFVPQPQYLYTTSDGTEQVDASTDPIGLGLDQHDSDGRGVVNLLTHTEEFDNAAWTKDNSTITANAATAPDGTVTADKIVPSATTSDHRIYQSAAIGTGVIGVISAHLKASGYNFVQLFTGGGWGTSTWVNFDLLNGAVGNSGPDATGLITEIGDGWYRCVAIFSVASNSSSAFWEAAPLPSDIDSRDPSYTGDGTSGVYVWGAQLELGSSASPYQGNTDTVGGPGYHANQSTADSRPQYILDANGREFSRYDGTDDYLDTGVTSMGNTGLFCDSNETFCVAGVARARRVHNGGVVFRGGDISGGRTFGLVFEGGGDLALTLRGVKTVLTAYSSDVWYVFLINWDGVSATAMLNTLSPTALGVGTATEESLNIIVGAGNDGTYIPLDGDIGTTLIRDKSLTVAQQQQLLKSLAFEYGIDL